MKSLALNTFANLICFFVSFGTQVAFSETVKPHDSLINQGEFQQGHDIPDGVINEDNTSLEFEALNKIFQEWRDAVFRAQKFFKQNGPEALELQVAALKTLSELSKLVLEFPSDSLHAYYQTLTHDKKLSGPGGNVFTLNMILEQSSTEALLREPQALDAIISLFRMNDTLSSGALQRLAALELSNDKALSRAAGDAIVKAQFMRLFDVERAVSALEELRSSNHSRPNGSVTTRLERLVLEYYRNEAMLEALDLEFLTQQLGYDYSLELLDQLRLAFLFPKQKGTKGAQFKTFEMFAHIRDMLRPDPNGPWATLEPKTKNALFDFIDGHLFFPSSSSDSIIDYLLSLNVALEIIEGIGSERQSEYKAKFESHLKLFHNEIYKFAKINSVSMRFPVDDVDGMKAFLEKLSSDEILSLRFDEYFGFVHESARRKTIDGLDAPPSEAMLRFEKISQNFTELNLSEFMNEAMGDSIPVEKVVVPYGETLVASDRWQRSLAAFLEDINFYYTPWSFDMELAVIIRAAFPENLSKLGFKEDYPWSLSLESQLRDFLIYKPDRDDGTPDVLTPAVLDALKYRRTYLQNQINRLMLKAIKNQDELLKEQSLKRELTDLDEFMKKYPKLREAAMQPSDIDPNLDRIEGFPP